MKLEYRDIEKYEVVDDKQFDKIVANSRPAIIKNSCFGYCTKGWTLDYLEDKLKEDIVVIHESSCSDLDFLNKNFDYVSVPFSTFAERLRKVEGTRSIYLRSTSKTPRAKRAARIEDDFPSLSKDLTPPSFIPYGANNKLYHSSVLRIASCNVQIWTHFDLYDNVLCQVVGTKRVILFPPEDVQNLYVEGDKSMINKFDDDDDKNYKEYLDKFPLILKTTPYKCLLKPGDTLFIPALWWHNIKTFNSDTLKGLKNGSDCCSIGFNIFWRDVEIEERSQYAENDIYGNKNLKPFDFAISNVNKAIEHLEKLPDKYKMFYKLMLLNKVRSKLFPTSTEGDQ